MTKYEKIWWVKALAAVGSGLLLWGAFPPVSQSDSAWMALVPLFLVIRVSTPRGAFGWSFVCGVIFWLLTLSWFPAIIKNGGPWPLVLLGQAGLSVWCALFMALFGAASARIWRWAGAVAGWRRVLAVTVCDPLLWVGSEYLRGWLLSGFAWNFLGVSQVAQVSLIQVASVAGVYAVSALVILVNGSVAGLLARAVRPITARIMGSRDWVCDKGFVSRLMRSAESSLPFVLVLLAWYWGGVRMREWRVRAHDQASWRIALVQPNSPCIFTVNDHTVCAQRQRLLDQTRLVGAAKPDLVVWPETAVMGAVPEDPDAMQVIREGAVLASAPLLTGALEIERVDKTTQAPEGMLFYNAAWLFSSTGEAMGAYRKQHLVPFGEYIPLDKQIPVLQRFAPTGVSCTAGLKSGVLYVSRAPNDTLAVGPLICFEDTVASLSRRAVQTGARLLILMTNDAWFNGSIEPLQHLQQAVFRAVENGVPLVRAANSGVSCAVDVLGQVRGLTSQGEVADFDGFLVTPVQVPSQPFFAPYVRWGDWVLAIPGALVLLLLTLGGFMSDQWQKKKELK